MLERLLITDTTGWKSKLICQSSVHSLIANCMLVVIL